MGKRVQAPGQRLIRMETPRHKMGGAPSIIPESAPRRVSRPRIRADILLHAELCVAQTGPGVRRFRRYLSCRSFTSTRRRFRWIPGWTHSTFAGPTTRRCAGGHRRNELDLFGESSTTSRRLHSTSKRTLPLDAGNDDCSQSHFITPVIDHARPRPDLPSFPLDFWRSSAHRGRKTIPDLRGRAAELILLVCRIHADGLAETKRGPH